MSNNEPSLESALDLLVYVPVGVALTLGEELPKLAAKGRARLGGPMTAALLIGRLAVQQGRREMDRRVGSTPSPVDRNRRRDERASAERTAGEPQAKVERLHVVDEPSDATRCRTVTSTPSTRPPVVPDPAAAAPRSRPAATRRPAAPSARRAQSSGRTPTGGRRTSATRVPVAASLAIPGYDSLSASQVVQRLAGLSGTELEAVRAYETAGRGRRTILAKASQLQAR